MTARKTRPNVGDPINDGMSVRDMAAALGVNKSELARWQALARIPEHDFDDRIEHQKLVFGEVKTGRMFGPVPTRGRVDRAVGIVNAMTDAERAEFYAQIGGAQ